jgi:hypothetical protein
MTALGIILTVVSAVGVAIVSASFIWAAREDGREQKRVSARAAKQITPTPRAAHRGRRRPPRADRPHGRLARDRR